MSTEAKLDDKASEFAGAPDLVETTAPSGMNLRPEPDAIVRISKRVGLVLVGLAIILCGVLAYSGISRQKQRAAAALNGPQKKPEPAKPEEFQQSLATPTNPVNRLSVNAAAASIPTNQNQLQTSATNLPTERVIIRSSPAPRPTPPPIAAHAVRETTPEERALVSAYTSEQQARLAATGIRTGSSGATDRSFHPAQNESAPSLEPVASPLSRDGSRKAVSSRSAENRSDFEDENAQSQKESFLGKARLDNTREDYLRFTRTAPMSRFEIKAGWEIPAALEQALNSDLPGEVKALVMSNVYDTSSGLYLLIPQGSRLVGVYNSHVTYGQTGLQVVWNRMIFPDASAIDLNGMNGLDAQGNTGLREKVDRHYKQLFGFAVLTSMFDAALAITQNRQQSILVYPRATQDAESAAGREVSQLGTQITRKNMNIQPTVKISAGYKFNVRVNRDILFEEAYRPEAPQQIDSIAVSIPR